MPTLQANFRQDRYRIIVNVQDLYCVLDFMTPSSVCSQGDNMFSFV